MLQDDFLAFQAPASLRKWPSKNTERRTQGRSAYLQVDATLEECDESFWRNLKLHVTSTKFTPHHSLHW